MAEVAAQDNPSPKSGAAAVRPKSGKATMAAVAAAVAALVLGVWWYSSQKSSTPSADNSGAGSGLTILPLESFTVNLADAEEGRFLRVTMALGVAGQLPAMTKGSDKAPESSAVSIAVIRDSILAVLAQSKSDDLLTPQGKAKLKQDLITALDRDVSALQVREVYFTEFMVQR